MSKKMTAAERELKAFGSLPPTARSGAAAKRARSAACAFADGRGGFGAVGILLRKDTAAVARRGLYALLSGIAIDAGGGPDCVEAALSVLLEMLGGCSGRTGPDECTLIHGFADETLSRECFKACGGWLQEMMGSASLAPGNFYLVLSIVSKLTDDSSSPGVALVKLSREFGGALVSCILRCKGKPELRTHLRLAVGCLSAVLRCDSAAEGLNDVLGSGKWS